MARRIYCRHIDDSLQWLSGQAEGLKPQTRLTYLTGVTHLRDHVPSSHMLRDHTTSVRRRYIESEVPEEWDAAQSASLMEMEAMVKIRELVDTFKLSVVPVGADFPL